jgi:hypothetical protein
MILYGRTTYIDFENLYVCYKKILKKSYMYSMLQSSLNVLNEEILIVYVDHNNFQYYSISMLHWIVSSAIYSLSLQ